MISRGAKSNERFAWLLGSGEAPAVKLDSAQEFEEACHFALSNWHILQVTAPRLKSWATDAFHRHPSWRLVDERVLSLGLLGRLRLTLLRRIAEAIEHRRIPYVLLKGTAMGFSAYPSPTLRVGQDIDIGVPFQYLNDFQEAIKPLGFEPGEWFAADGVFRQPDLAERTAAETGHYELGYLVRRQVLGDLSEYEESVIRRNIRSEPEQTWHITEDGQLACYLIIDLHHGLIQSVSVDSVVYSGREIEYQGRLFRVASNAWALFHLILKIYWEGVNNYGVGAYQYGDLTRLITQSTDSDINELVSLLVQYKLEAGGYYVMRRLDSEFKSEIYPTLRKFLDRAAVPPTGSGPADENDFGDMWQKLWGYR